MSDAGDSPRAAILRELSPESLAVGYDDTQNRWVTAADTTDGFDPLPPLTGVLVVNTTGAGGDDFGHVVSAPPSAVLRPGSARDVAATVRFAREHKLRVAPRGTAHTVFGQSQVPGGVLIDMTTLGRVRTVAAEVADVDAGALWSDVLHASLVLGRTPPVLTDQLDMSVGGTLSVGGVSGTSWRYGAQADNVESIDVVTGGGELVTCSESQEPELFEAVLAGQGQCGIIVAARLRLVQAQSRARVCDLIYPDLASLTADLRFLMDDGRFDYVVGVFLPAPHGWVPMLEAVSFYSPPAEPDVDAMVAGLRCIPGARQVFDQTYFDYSNRVVLQVGDVGAVGLLSAPHPWIDVFTPGTAVDAFLTGVLATLTPADLGRSFPVLLYPFKRSQLRRPMLRVPDEDEFFLFNILRAATPGATDPSRMLEDNRRLFEENRDLGGRNYPIGAVNLSAQDWERHFEPYWERLQAAKQRFDPDNVLTPGPGIFAG
jgi:cytokinin dehydrogenase